MYSLIQSIIGYGGDWTTNYNGYIVQASLVIVVLATIVAIDFLYKLFLGLIPRKHK